MLVCKKRYAKDGMRITFSLLLAAALLLSGCGRNERGGGEEDYIGQDGGRGQEAESGTEQEPQGGLRQEDVQGEGAGEGFDSEAASDQVIFEGKDMEGNTVSSSIFAQSKLTMVNVWATYCNPCLSEMPYLGELSEEYDEEEFQLIGIVGDVLEGDDQENIDLAKALISQTGADYTHMLVNESLYLAFMTDLEGVPTSFFINEQGEIIDVVLGAMKKEDWKEKIDGLLEDL